MDVAVMVTSGVGFLVALLRRPGLSKWERIASFVGLAGIGISFAVLLVLCVYVGWYHDRDALQIQKHLNIVIYVVLGFPICFVLSVLLVVGVHQRNRYLMAPWIVVYGLCLFALSVAFSKTIYKLLYHIQPEETVDDGALKSIMFDQAFVLGTMIPPWIIVCKAYHHQHCLYQNRQIVSNQELPL